MPAFKNPIKNLLNKDYVPPPLASLDEVTYCLSCVDQRTGEIGYFAFDEALYLSTGAHFAITPVCFTVDVLLDYLREQGFTEHPRDAMLTVRRAK